MTMLSDEAHMRVEALMLEFREFVFGIEQERLELKSRINHLAKVRRNQKQQIHQHHQEIEDHQQEQQAALSPRSRTTTTLPTRTPGPAATTTATSTSDSSQSATTTTTTDKTESTKPPSYRTAVPQPPARSKRKSATIHFSSSSSQPSSTTTTVKSIDIMSALGGRGALIVLEGLDRVGKSTLAQNLVKHLQRTHKPVQHMRFPNRETEIGQLISKLLKTSDSGPSNRALHLLFSSDRWDHDQKIRDILNQGTTVIVDRYSYSGIAYSCAQGNLDMSWCCSVEAGLPKPDLVIYLELPERAQMRRPGYGDERFENSLYQRSVREQYEKIISISKEEWLRIDVDHKGPEEVLATIVEPVRNCLQACANKPLGDLAFKG